MVAIVLYSPTRPVIFLRAPLGSTTVKLMIRSLTEGAADENDRTAVAVTARDETSRRTEEDSIMILFISSLGRQ